MDINEVYIRMIEKLKAHNWQDIVTIIENLNAGATTGSEALMTTGHYLMGLKYTNPSTYELIKGEISDYLKYCKNNGITIK
mgnify:CR=1 FL=1